MTVSPEVAQTGLVRGAATWYSYLLIGTFIYLLNVQGNVIPFLQSEFALSYRVVSLHSSAIAIGVVIVGFLGERVTRRLGRRLSLWLGAGGLATGAFLLCLSPAPWMSIASCLLIGLFGSLLPSVVPAIMADLHGERRDQAFAEQAILAYAFAVVGPLLTGYFVTNGLGWRYSVALGGVLGFALIFLFRTVPLPETHAVAVAGRARLPAPFWAYCCLLGFSCALEFSVLLWAPAFLERVVGLSAAAAATSAAGFFVGVLVGRIALRGLLRTLAASTILFSALAVGLAGFALYWGVGTPTAAIAGITMLGLCVAPLYPLAMTLGIGAAKGANDAASARLTLAFGIAVLVAPATLGALADVVGLSYAHLTLPALIAAMMVSFLAAGVLNRRVIQPA